MGDYSNCNVCGKELSAWSKVVAFGEKRICADCRDKGEYDTCVVCGIDIPFLAEVELVGNKLVCNACYESNAAVREQIQQASHVIDVMEHIKNGSGSASLLEEQQTSDAESISKEFVEVSFPDSKIRKYDDVAKLCTDIINGDVKGDYKARILNNSGNDENKWSSVQEIANSDFDLQILFRPIWAHSIRGFKYGVGVGILLAATNIAIDLLSIDRTISTLWIVFCAVIIALFFDSKIAFGILFLSAIALKGDLLQFAQNFPLFIGIQFGVVVVGSMMGGPIGMVIGAIVGHLRRSHLPSAADLNNEKDHPYFKGIVLPLIWLGVAFPAYFLWFVPNALEWLSRFGT